MEFDNDNDILGYRSCHKHIVKVEAAAILKVCRRYFLIVELEVRIHCAKIEHVVVIEISKEEAKALIQEGIQVIVVASKKPKSHNIRLKCIFILGHKAYAVFEVENGTGELVVVKIHHHKALEMKKQGVPLCSVVKKEHTCHHC